MDDPNWQSHGNPTKPGGRKTLSTLLLTDYFPGLGWMMRQDTWVEELGPSWQDYPTTGWDHFVRTLPLGDCVYPLVPRTKHIGNAHGSNVVGGRKQEYANMAFNDHIEEVRFDFLLPAAFAYNGASSDMGLTSYHGGGSIQPADAWHVVGHLTS